MGDGKKLKEHIDNKGTNVRKIAKETGISATTLYTIIQKDTNIRFDFALRLANALDIDVNEICSLPFISWMMKPGKRLWKRYNLSCSIIRMQKEQNR